MSMDTEVSAPQFQLPEKWKQRLNEQKPVSRERQDEAADAPEGVRIEPTEPAADHNLPSFVIKQDMRPQPSAKEPPLKQRLIDLRPSVIAAIAGIAAVGTGILVVTL